MISKKGGSAAGRIRKSLANIEKSREDFSITNAIQCYPGKSSDKNRDNKPREQARKACAKRLKLDIESHKWCRIIVFGRVAEKSVKCLGYGEDKRFCFITHPTGGLKKKCLKKALRWAYSI